jgi:PTH2 family peptidyl-tRNA hydrolase
MSHKQVIVMRTDLNMRKGKMVAQGAHASMKAVLDYGTDNFHVKPWLESKFKKICVQVDSELELLELYNRALDRDIPCALIRDAGLTEFDGVPTLTCVAIGPAHEDHIDPITGDLKLL